VERLAKAVYRISISSGDSEKMVTHYRIGEFAVLGGVSAKTLRFYDDIGLLRPAASDPRTRYRHYHPQQLQDLAAILALKDLGLSLPEIRLAMNRDASRVGRRRLLETLKAAVEHSIQEAGRKLRWVQSALDDSSHSHQPAPVVVKRRPAIRVASVRSRVKTYADILPLEQHLFDALPSASIGRVRGVLWHRCAD
jgi:DNA-binding transcriptional MerR regulator